MEDVALGALADGDNMVGFAHRLTKLPGVDLCVEPVVVLGVAQEDEVVDGDHALYTALGDAYGQLAREAVVEFNAVTAQAAEDAMAAPVGLGEPAQGQAAGIARTDIVTAHDLAPQMADAVVGGVKTHLEGQRCEVVDERAGVTAQARGVAEGALGVVTDDHRRLKTVLTRTKFVGTAMASTAIGANSRLRPSQRKKLKSTMCNR